MLIWAEVEVLSFNFMGVLVILPRKIISASISGTLLAIIIAIIASSPFVLSSGYIFDVVSSIPIYMIYIFPAVFIYGIPTSIVSDKIGEFVANKSDEKKAGFIVSSTLHVIFGLILLWFSLGASILFFITDRVIRKRNKSYGWIHAIYSLVIALMIWLIFMGIVWGN